MQESSSELLTLAARCVLARDASWFSGDVAVVLGGAHCDVGGSLFHSELGSRLLHRLISPRLVCADGFLGFGGSRG